MLTLLTCQLPECNKVFLRAVTGAPAKHCSKTCRNRALYLSTKGVGRSRRPVGRSTVQKPRRPRQRAAYDRAYRQRPEVQERSRNRAASLYVAHPRVQRPQQVTPEVASPYTGHQWLEMARAAAGPDLDRSRGETAEWQQDEMGEALLALMEGHDPKAAVAAYRKKEYVARHMTQHLSEWANKEDSWRLDMLLPTVPSAEDEVVARETVMRKTRYHGGKGKALMGQSRQQQPSRRRQKDAGWRRVA